MLSWADRAAAEEEWDNLRREEEGHWERERG